MTIQSIFKNEFNIHPQDQVTKKSIGELLIAAQDQGLDISLSDTSQLILSLDAKTVKPLKFLT